MDLQLAGKRALVTGSSSGIGEQIAKTLATEGVSVVIYGRREVEARRVAKEVLDAGGKAAVVFGDLSSDTETFEVVKHSLAAFGGIDILVNNAGAFPSKKWLDSTAAEWLELYNANVGSVVRLVTQLVPAMKDRRWGRVIMIGSFFGPMPESYVANYSATKVAKSSRPFRWRGNSAEQGLPAILSVPDRSALQAWKM